MSHIYPQFRLMQKCSYLPKKKQKNIAISFQYLQFIDDDFWTRNIWFISDFWLSFWVWSLQSGRARLVKHTENLSISKIHSKIVQKCVQNFAKLPFHIHSSHSSLFSQKIQDCIICVKLRKVGIFSCKNYIFIFSLSLSPLTAHSLCIEMYIFPISMKTFLGFISRLDEKFTKSLLFPASHPQISENKIKTSKNI